MANQLIIDLKLNDTASAGLNKAKNNVTSFAAKAKASFVELAAKVFIVQQAFRALNSIIGGVIRAATEQEDAIKRLNSALQIQGTFTEELSKKYQDFSQELQRSTRFGDEAIQGLIQQLISVGNVGPESMERATRAAIDFAAATGRDLNTAALTVGKAMTGFTGELSRYGIIIDQNIPKTEKAKAALEAMERQFGGFAQKEVNTFSGQVAQLSNAWGDLTEELGLFVTGSKTSVEAVKKIKFAVEEATQGLRDFRDLIDKIGVIGLAVPAVGFAKIALAIQDAKRENEEWVKGLEDGNISLSEMDTLLSRVNEALAIRNEIQQESIDINNAIAEAEALRQKQAEDNATRILENVKTNAQSLANSISSGFSSSLSSLITGSKTAKEAFSDLGKSMIKIIADYIAQTIIAKTIGEAIQKVSVAASIVQAKILEKAWQPAAVFASIATAGGAAAAGTAGIITTFGVATALAKASSVVPLAEGGIVTKPTVALIGEAGPEAVIPLNKRRNQGSLGSGNISFGDIIIQGSVDERNIDSLSEQLGLAVANNMRVARGI